MCGELGPPRGALRRQDSAARARRVPGSAAGGRRVRDGAGARTRAGADRHGGSACRRRGARQPAEAGEPDGPGPGGPGPRSCRRGRLRGGRRSSEPEHGQRAELVAAGRAQAGAAEVGSRSAAERCFACCSRRSVSYGVVMERRPGRDAARDRASSPLIWAGAQDVIAVQRAGVVVADGLAVEHRTMPTRMSSCRPS